MQEDQVLSMKLSDGSLGEVDDGDDRLGMGIWELGREICHWTYRPIYPIYLKLASR
jgi:hypothetical protein